MLDAVMDIDIGQIKDSSLIVSTEDAGDLVWDIPTEGRGEVVVVADDLVQFLERDVAAVPWQDAMIGERVQRWARAPTIVVGGGDVFGPAPTTDSDLPRRLLGRDKVVEHKTEVGLEEEEDLDEQKSWWGEKRASERVARGQLSFIWLGSLGRRQT